MHEPTDFALIPFVNTNYIFALTGARDRVARRDVHVIGFRIDNFRILQNSPVWYPVLGC